MNLILLKFRTFCWIVAGLLAVAFGPGQLVGGSDWSPADRIVGGLVCLVMARRADRIAHPPHRSNPQPRHA